MSVRATQKTSEPGSQLASALETLSTESALAEGASIQTACADTPLQRNIVVSVRASLNDLCLSKQKGTWAPSTEALKSIFQ